MPITRCGHDVGVVNILEGMLLVSTCEDECVRAYHHGDLRCALLVAAGELLDEGGAAAISLREVARRAGVSHNAPYRHFADRDALLAALAAEGFAELSRRMALLPASRLQALGQCYVAFALEQPGRFALMFGGVADKQRYPQLQQAAQALYRQLGASVQAVAPGQDLTTASLAAWSLVHGLAQLLLDDQLPGQDAEAAAQAVTGLFVAGLGDA